MNFGYWLKTISYWPTAYPGLITIELDQRFFLLFPLEKDFLLIISGSGRCVFLNDLVRFD